MKLRNKKTGEIGYPYFQNWKEISCVIVDENAIQIAEYTSLAELNEEWEDVPEEEWRDVLGFEPKESYFIDSQGDIQVWRNDVCDDWSKEKAIGNYFGTREEAEKAVEKLKAWKRLKDKGFRFALLEYTLDGDIDVYGSVRFGFLHYEKCNKDIELLFGGEE